MWQDPFEYVAPNGASVETIKKVREKCSELNSLLNDIPNCRERSIAITKLEEVSMWANKAIIFTQNIT